LNNVEAKKGEKGIFIKSHRPGSTDSARGERKMAGSSGETKKGKQAAKYDVGLTSAWSDENCKGKGGQASGQASLGRGKNRRGEMKEEQRERLKIE